MSSEDKKTALYDIHCVLGARMGPFGGYLMPIQYDGIIREHTATRTSAALFDTCHMGEFKLSGPTAEHDLERLLSCRISTLATGRCRYGLMCNAQGGVIDDLVIYRLSDSEFMLVVNAGTQDTDFEWITRSLSARTKAINISAETAKVDLQGPHAPRMMQQLMDQPISSLRFYEFMTNTYAGQEVVVSRTGYTGEIGFEFYGGADLACHFWNAAMKLGAVPAGLGARDTLRLEMGMPLYGHEMDEVRNAAEAGFTRAIATDKEFIGAAVVTDPARKSASLVGIRLEGRRAAREGSIIHSLDGTEIGKITSGSMAPSLGCAIALAYVKPGACDVGTTVDIKTPRAALRGQIIELPFYKNATGRRPMKDFV